MKIGAVSLGCDKNRVDTEKMLARLTHAGHSIVGSAEDADIIIVNTCAFIEAAKEESIDEILSAAQFKKKGGKKLIVTGCLSERYAEQLEKEFPEVDAFLGIADYDEIASVVNKIKSGDKVFCYGGGDAFYKDRILTTPYHYAYLKIADGCDNHCTYCAIPSIRGRYRSESRDSLLAEAAALADRGVKELILVAQDVTRYGVDFDGKPHLKDLVRELEKLDFDWIRLLYLEPEMVDDALIDFIASEPKVVKYADIPLQHIDDSILKLMNRRTTEAYSRELVGKLKSKGISVRSTFICGFPGESEEAFDKLKRFIEEERLDYAGFFAYSREEGTAADRLKGHINAELKEERVEQLRCLQNEIIESSNKEKIGKTFKVIYDDIDYEKQMFVGRAEFQAPDVDGRILFSSEKPINIGCFYDVQITGTDGIDPVGVTLESQRRDA